MTTVYANQEDVIIWSGGDMVHKQGRVHLNEPLLIKTPYAQNWYIIERPEGLYLGDDPNPEPDPNYPDYWVRREFCSAIPIDGSGPEPEPEPVPEPEPSLEYVSNEELASAIIVLLRWLRQSPK